MQKLQQEVISSINMKIVNGLAETLSVHPGEYMPWLVDSSSDCTFSKTLLFLVLMQSFLRVKNSKFLLCYKNIFCPWANNNLFLCLYFFGRTLSPLKLAPLFNLYGLLVVEVHFYQLPHLHIDS